MRGEVMRRARHHRQVLRGGMVALAVGLVACSPARVERTEWVLTEPPDGAQLQLAVFAGHSTCLTFDRVDVDEDEQEVRVRAYVVYSGAGACSDDFVTERVTLDLAAELGDRRLVGCADQAISWRGWRLDPATDCTEPRDQ